MQVKIYEATLTINEVERPLTRKMARQFPVLDHAARFDAAMVGDAQPVPILKVAAATLSVTMYKWLYLVEDDESGLGWVAPVTVAAEFGAKVVEGGGWVDNPANVPTVILR
jgi:hypothetical protein